MRVDGKVRTIPAGRVEAYEKLEADVAGMFDSDDERRAALEAAALYLLEVPPAPSSGDRGAARMHGIHDSPTVEAAVETVEGWADSAGAFMARYGARRSAADAAARAIAVVSDAPEALIASSLGVNRSTVRRWRGKDERK